MKKTRYKLFSFLFIDHHVAQQLLNDMARQGWELDTFLGPFARFRPTERTDLTYFLDWYDPQEQNDADYIQLCEDAGWERKCQWKYCTIYASRPGLSPAPIQTDPALEYLRFKEKALRRKGLNALGSLGSFLLHFLILVFFAVVLFSVGTDTTFDWLELLLTIFASSNGLTLLIFCLPFLLIVWAAYYIFLGLRLYRWKNALNRGESIPSGGKAVQIWKVLSFLRFLCLLFSLFLYWFDALFNHVGHWAYPVVFLFAGIMAALSADEKERSKLYGGILLCCFSAITLLCLFLNAPLRTIFPGRLPSVPVIAEHELRWENNRSDTLLGSSTEWVENLPGEIISFRAKANTWQSDTLTQWSLKNMLKDAMPLDGYSGIWTVPSTVSDYFTTYILIEGNTQVQLICRAEEFQDFLPEILQWMEQIK